MDDQTANVLIGITVVLIIILVWYLATRRKSDDSYVFIGSDQIDDDVYKNALYNPQNNPTIDYSRPEYGFYRMYGSRHYGPFRHGHHHSRW